LSEFEGESGSPPVEVLDKKKSYWKCEVCLSEGLTFDEATACETQHASENSSSSALSDGSTPALRGVDSGDASTTRAGAASAASLPAPSRRQRGLAAASAALPKRAQHTKGYDENEDDDDDDDDDNTNVHESNAAADDYVDVEDHNDDDDDDDDDDDGDNDNDDDDDEDTPFQANTASAHAKPAANHEPARLLLSPPASVKSTPPPNATHSVSRKQASASAALLTDVQIEVSTSTFLDIIEVREQPTTSAPPPPPPPLPQF
jgi:hypothetical protein